MSPDTLVEYVPQYLSRVCPLMPVSPCFWCHLQHKRCPQCEGGWAAWQSCKCSLHTQIHLPLLHCKLCHCGWVVCQYSIEFLKPSTFCSFVKSKWWPMTAWNSLRNCLKSHKLFLGNRQFAHIKWLSFTGVDLVTHPHNFVLQSDWRRCPIWATGSQQFELHNVYQAISSCAWKEEMSLGTKLGFTGVDLVIACWQCIMLRLAKELSIGCWVHSHIPVHVSVLFPYFHSRSAVVCAVWDVPVHQESDTSFLISEHYGTNQCVA